MSKKRIAKLQQKISEKIQQNFLDNKKWLAQEIAKIRQEFNI